MRIYTQINGLESIKLGIPAGGDIIWQKPNITHLVISRCNHNFGNFTDIKAISQLW
jgi:hypothetical protein